VSLARAEVRAVKPEKVVLRMVGNETVLLNTDTGRYFALNDVGTQVWARLMSEASVQAACDALCREFDADLREIEMDVDQLLARLDAEGLVEIRRVEP